MDTIQYISYCYQGHPELIPAIKYANHIITISYYLIGYVVFRVGYNAVRYKKGIELPKNPYVYIHAGLFIISCGNDHLIEPINIENSIPFIGYFDAAYLAFTNLWITALVSASFCIRLLRANDFKELEKKHIQSMDNIKYNLFKSDIINNMPGMIFLVNRHGQFVDANKRACDTLGYSQSELQGRYFLSILVPEYKEGTEKAYNDPNVMVGFQLALNEYLKKRGGNQKMYWINDRKVRGDGDFFIAQAIDGNKVLDLSTL